LYYNCFNRYDYRDIYRIKCSKEDLIYVLEYDKWEIEAYENHFMIVYHDLFNITVNSDYVILSCELGVYSFTENKVQSKDKTVEFTEDYIIPIVDNPITVRYNNCQLSIILNSETIFTKCVYTISLGNLSLNIGDYKISYSDQKISKDIIKIQEYIEFDISTEEQDPELIVATDEHIHILPYNNVKEEYYMIAKPDNKQLMLIADISYMKNNNHFYFALSIINDNYLPNLPISKKNIVLYSFKNIYTFDVLNGQIFDNSKITNTPSISDINNLLNREIFNNSKITNTPSISDINNLFNVQLIENASDRLKELVSQIKSLDDDKWLTIQKILDNSRQYTLW
jgi:hypothetical protein